MLCRAAWRTHSCVPRRDSSRRPSVRQVPMPNFEFQTRTRLLFGEGTIGRLGALSLELGFRRTLLVSDRGLLAAGHVAQATTLLRAAGIETIPFHDFDANPALRMVENGRDFVASAAIT